MTREILISRDRSGDRAIGGYLPIELSGAVSRSYSRLTDWMVCGRSCSSGSCRRTAAVEGRREEVGARASLSILVLGVVKRQPSRALLPYITLSLTFTSVLRILTCSRTFQNPKHNVEITLNSLPMHQPSKSRPNSHRMPVPYIQDTDHRSHPPIPLTSSASSPPLPRPHHPTSASDPHARHPKYTSCPSTPPPAHP